MRRATATCSLSIIVLVLLLLLALPQAKALGAGGKDIASGPVVVYGQQEFGNTATDGGTNAGSLWNNEQCSHVGTNGWWNLPVIAGDHARVDWEAPPTHYLEVFAAGTTDFTVPEAHEFAESQISENGRAELSFTASVTGIMPMVIGAGSCFSSGSPGAYNFVAVDQHKLIVSLVRRAYIIPTNTLTAHAYLADGSPVPDDLEFWLNAYWRRHGFAQYRAVSSGGSLRFPLALPRPTEHHTVTFVVVRPAGARYQAARSARLRSHVNPPASNHHGHGHRHHHHRRHSR